MGRSGGGGICAATRMHQAEVSRPLNFGHLGAFVETVAPSVSRIAIAVGAPGESQSRLHDIVQGAKRAIEGKSGGVPVEVIAVDPWGNFLPALNALTANAARNGCETILFASVEAAPVPSVIDALRDVLDDDLESLVAGAALPGHDFRVGERELTGITSPWNTLALWRLETLALVGFPLVSEGIAADGGVEETSAIECFARIMPDKARAYLVRLPEVVWQTTFDDPKRAEWHARKMASKASRAAAHLALLGPPPSGARARVTHIDRWPEKKESATNEKDADPAAIDEHTQPPRTLAPTAAANQWNASVSGSSAAAGTEAAADDAGGEF